MVAAAKTDEREKVGAAAGGRRTGLLLLGLLVAANVLLGLALFGLRPPRGAAPEAAPPDLPPQAEQLRRRVAEGRPGEAFSLTLDDAELTATVGYFLARRPEVPFGRVRVQVLGDRVVAEGVTRGLAVTVPVRVTGTIGATNGLPVARIEDVSLGSTALPSFVREQVRREANASLDFSRYPMPLRVDAIETRPGGMTVRGTLR